MIKKMISVMIIVMLLVGCNTTRNTATIESNTWRSLVDHEWSNMEIWAGTGFYFYEEDGVPHCTYMLYGSGVRVMGSYDSEVTIEEEGMIIISLPEYVSSGHLTDDDTLTDEPFEVILSYDNDTVYFGDFAYEVHDDIGNYEYIMKMKE